MRYTPSTIKFIYTKDDTVRTYCLHNSIHMVGEYRVTRNGTLTLHVYHHPDGHHTDLMSMSNKDLFAFKLTNPEFWIDDQPDMHEIYF